MVGLDWGWQARDSLCLELASPPVLVPPGPSKGKELEEEWAPTEKISEWEPGRGGGVQSPFLLCNFCPGVRGVPGVQGSYIK